MLAKKILTVWIIVQVFYLTNVYPFAHHHNPHHAHSHEAVEMCHCLDDSHDHSREVPFVHYHHGCSPDCHKQSDADHFDPEPRYLISKSFSKLGPGSQILSCAKELPEQENRQENNYPVILTDSIPSISTCVSTFSRRGPPKIA